MRISGNPPSGGKKPTQPTSLSATAGNASASVSFTIPDYTGKGGIVTYRALSNPGSIEATNTASPIPISGLTNGTAYTFTVRAEASYGVLGDYSSASNQVTPVAPPPPPPPTTPPPTTPPPTTPPPTTPPPTTPPPTTPPPTTPPPTTPPPPPANNGTTCTSLDVAIGCCAYGAQSGYCTTGGCGSGAACYGSSNYCNPFAC